MLIITYFVYLGLSLLVDFFLCRLQTQTCLELVTISFRKFLTHIVRSD